MKKKNLQRIILCFIVFVVGFLLYYYPVQRICAEIDLGKYLEVQGISQDNIKNKRAYKDYKQNGYLFDISLYDDSDIIYQYKYYFLSKQHEETFHIHCIARKNGTEVPLRLVKYPPIH